MPRRMRKLCVQRSTPAQKLRASFFRLLATALPIAITSAGCGGAEPLAQESDGPAAGGATASGGATGGGARSIAGGGSGPAAGCVTPAGVSGRPQTIEQATALLAALPRPTDAACFLQSLERPLEAYATTSQFSAQPAHSRQSPRIFLKFGQLVVSVVIDGESSDLIEFGYLLEGDVRSIKAEVHLPIDAELSASAPYDRVREGTGTRCSVCHGEERREESLTSVFAYSSFAYQPNPMYRVPLDELRQGRQACDARLEPRRCRMLAALFDGGSVTDAVFPAGMQRCF